jgi:ribosome-associated protein
MRKKQVKINTPFIKLDSLLKFSGVTQTGGQSKELIAQGLVFVNGENCTMRGRKIYAGNIVVMDDIEIEVVSD